MIVLLLIASLSLLITVGLTLYSGVSRLRSFEALEAIRQTSDWPAPPVSIVIPARNEARNIRRCLESLLKQTYPADRLEYVVVDDCSTDETAEIVRRLAAADRRVKLATVETLPDGWMGKQFACWLGAQTAAGVWLCFIDADTCAAPTLLASAVAFAQKRHLDFLSVVPYQEALSPAERLVLPLGWVLVGISTDICRINDPRSPRVAAANGQFVLVRRTVYESVRGHSHPGVRMTTLEDVALARVVKAAGYRIMMILHGGMISTRMYTRLSDLWAGLSKLAGEVLASSRGKALVASAGQLAIGWGMVVLPAAAWQEACAHPENRLVLVSLGVSLSATALFVALYAAVLARFFRTPPGYALLLPLSLTFTSLLTFNTVWLHHRGRVTWKGRLYSPQGWAGKVEESGVVGAQAGRRTTDE